MNKNTEEKVIGKVYLDVGDSGVSFIIKDEGHGPTIEIKSSSFGNLAQSFKIHTTYAGLTDLAELFDMASKDCYSKDYIYAAHPLRANRFKQNDQDSSQIIYEEDSDQDHHTP